MRQPPNLSRAPSRQGRGRAAGAGAAAVPQRVPRCGGGVRAPACGGGGRGRRAAGDAGQRGRDPGVAVRLRVAGPFRRRPGRCRHAIRWPLQLRERPRRAVTDVRGRVCFPRIREPVAATV